MAPTTASPTVGPTTKTPTATPTASPTRISPTSSPTRKSETSWKRVSSERCRRDRVLGGNTARKKRALSKRVRALGLSLIHI
eukprot:6819875-Pyramimonas_sp.AAC.1